MRYPAEQRDLAESIASPLASWYASPATHLGHELIAGMMILAGGEPRRSVATPKS